MRLTKLFAENKHTNKQKSDYSVAEQQLDNAVFDVGQA